MEKAFDKNSITISNGRNNNYRQIRSSSNWFNCCDYYTVSENENCLKVVKHYLEIPKTAQKTNKGYFHCLSKLPLVIFFFNKEESTEDVAIIYCS